MHFLLFIIFGSLSSPKYEFISETVKCRHFVELRRQGTGLLEGPLMCRVYQAQRYSRHTSLPPELLLPVSRQSKRVLRLTARGQCEGFSNVTRLSV
jgi:hypothetical protein